MPKQNSLAPRRDIIRFSLTWAQLYRLHRYTPGLYFEDPLFVGDGMAALGFSLDNPDNLAKYAGFGPASCLANWLEILQAISLRDLGDAIFTNWRYYNHWDATPMGEDGYKWFELGFIRLAILAGEKVNAPHMYKIAAMEICQ